LSLWNSAVDVYHDKDQFIVVAELAGLMKEEIEISLHDKTLISGERKREESSEQGFLTERFYGKFQRSLTLPAAVDPDK
jgi:HSP20 family protein